MVRTNSEIENFPHSCVAEMNGNLRLITVFIRMLAGAIIYFEADFPQNICQFLRNYISEGSANFGG